jgi:myo-inositol 2-dehydrogenase/D-chiro-inositol 1-dehydrogenase
LLGCAYPDGGTIVTLRVGVIGTGIMGADHAKTLDRFISGATVTRLADLDLERAAAVAAGIPEAQTLNDPYALISDTAVDAVVIASHDSTHADFVRACARAGKPVLCEKPLAVSSAESAALLRDIGPTGEDLLSVGFMRRFDPGYTAMREAIVQRRFGEPLLVHSIGRGVASGVGATSESAVTNSAIHDLDIVAWLLNSPVVEVSWHAGRQTSTADGLVDPQLFLLRTASGVLATVEMFLNARYGYDIRAEVVCESGAVTLAEPIRTVADRDFARRGAYAADWRPRFAEAYRLELQAWADALNGRAPAGSPMATGRDALTANAVADAVIGSYRTGGATRAVVVPAV